MIAEHWQATKARLVAHPNLSNKVEDAAREKDGKPVAGNYLILFPPYIEDLDDERFTRGQDVQSKATLRYDLKAVATTTAACVGIVEAALSQLLSWAPTVADRKNTPFELTLADKVRPDMSVTPPLYYCDLELEAVSDRA